MQLTRQELDIINQGLVNTYKVLHELEKQNAEGAELRRTHCWGYEELYFKVLELAGYDNKQIMDMYHEQLRIARDEDK